MARIRRGTVRVARQAGRRKGARCPSLTGARVPPPGRGRGARAGPQGCLRLTVCQVAMIECSSAIIAHINHHPLKRVNNILPSPLALAHSRHRVGRAGGEGRRAGQGQAGKRGSRRYTKRVDCMTERDRGNREGRIDVTKTDIDILYVLKRRSALRPLWTIDEGRHSEKGKEG